MTNHDVLLNNGAAMPLLGLGLACLAVHALQSE